MSNYEEWIEFLNNFFGNALKEFQKTYKYEALSEKQDELDKFLSSSITAEQKRQVEEYLFDISLAEENKQLIFYKQGMRDCVFILKQLGVLA